LIQLSDILNEFEADLKKQCIVLMGLPGAGKSTFINLYLPKYFTGFSGYKVSNSDKQLAKHQYQVAQNHYQYLTQTKTEEDIEKFSKNATYTSNQGKEVRHPVTWKWWTTNKDKGFVPFYKEFKSLYYINYYDIRAYAKQDASIGWKTKVITAGNFLVIDTTASNPSRILKQLNHTKANKFTNTICYLEIEPSYAVARDEYRGKTGDRSIGSNVILGYPKKLASALKVYKSDGKKNNGVVDRVMHFKWKGEVDPRKGSWIKMSDNKYFLKRKLKQIKNKKS
tara:strand:- start:400 stop:1242 length:843 start_codon:yes stop_codon:yes gene_type:complete